MSNAPLPLPTAFLPSVKAVVELLDLPPSWNSHSAKPISLRIVTAVIKILGVFLNSDTPMPTVVPRVKGNIQLEWHTDQIDIEVYIDSPNSVLFFAENVTTGQVSEGNLDGHEEELRKWLNRVSPD